MHQSAVFKKSYKFHLFFSNKHNVKWLKGNEMFRTSKWKSCGNNHVAKCTSVLDVIKPLKYSSAQVRSNLLSFFIFCKKSNPKLGGQARFLSFYPNLKNVLANEKCSMFCNILINFCKTVLQDLFSTSKNFMT